MLRLCLLPLCIWLMACSTRMAKPDARAEEPPPKMLSPLVKKIWIPAAIKNGGIEWEAGHYLYRIEREPTWSR